MMELRLDRREIGKDIGVVVFEIVEYRRARPIVDEFRALVAERGVVLVTLDDEERAVRKPSRDAEVGRDAADQETRLQSRPVEYPGQHRAGRRLAVRSGDRQHPLVEQHVFGEPLRTRNVTPIGIQYRLEQRVAAGDRVADDEHIGGRGDRVELRRIVAFGQRDPQARELRAHRRIDVGVAAGDRVAALPRDRGDPAHERPADAEDVQMHASLFRPTRAP